MNILSNVITSPNNLFCTNSSPSIPLKSIAAYLTIATCILGAIRIIPKLIGALALAAYVSSLITNIPWKSVKNAATIFSRIAKLYSQLTKHASPHQTKANHSDNSLIKASEEAETPTAHTDSSSTNITQTATSHSDNSLIKASEEAETPTAHTDSSSTNITQTATSHSDNSLIKASEEAEPTTTSTTSTSTNIPQSNANTTTTKTNTSPSANTTETDTNKNSLLESAWAKSKSSQSNQQAKLELIWRQFSESQAKKQALLKQALDNMGSKKCDRIPEVLRHLLISHL